MREKSFEGIIREGKIIFKKEKENVIMGIGFFAAVVAISTPFLIMYLNKYEYKIDTFRDLGTVGDFFGGSTVGLLSFASLLFITATMLMQKKELKLQREEIEKTREEYTVTNTTMKKQAFDSIFFQMLSFQRDITKEMKQSKSFNCDSDYFTCLLNELENYKKQYINSYNKKIVWDHFRELVDFKSVSDTESEHQIKLFEESIIRYIKENKKIYMEDGLRRSVNALIIDPTIANFKDLESEVNIIDIFEENKPINIYEVLKESFFPNIFRNFDDPYQIKWDINNISGIYEQFYRENVSEIGHYYRNMYRIVKMVKGLENKGETKETISSYLGIIRAQLSSKELLMLFYNINYSQKGEKFGELLEETNFFDNHLEEITDRFLWESVDTDELIKY